MARSHGNLTYNMKKIVLTVIYALLMALEAGAQTHGNDLHDDVVEKICGYVGALRSDPDGYEAVRDEMAGNMKWTMMSEFADSCSTTEALCGLRDRVKRTGINDIALQAEHKRGTVARSADLFCNGNDPKYNYSLYEVKVKAGQTVESRLSHRKGQQYFLIMPYSSGLNVEITCRDSKVPCTRHKDGSMSFTIRKPLQESETIGIRIINRTDGHLSAVIINHNSHRQ